MNDYEPSLACFMQSIMYFFRTVAEIAHSRGILYLDNLDIEAKL
jgi:hypothetical protein